MAFTCLRCRRTSHHPDAGLHGYCGACHEFTGEALWHCQCGVHVLTPPGFTGPALCDRHSPPAVMERADGEPGAGAVAELKRVAAGLGLIIAPENSSAPSSAEGTGGPGRRVRRWPGGSRQEISRGLAQSPPEQWQAVPALPAEPDGTAYNWRPGDPVLLKAQPGLDIYLDIYHTVPMGTKEVLLRLDEADHAELAKLAAGSDTSVTALIREGVAMVLGKYSDGRSPSPADYRAAAATLADIMDKLAAGHVLVPRSQLDGTSWSGILDEGSS